MMQLGIFAKTFEGTQPSVVLDQVAAAGYEAVQYNMACSGIGSLPIEVPEAIAEAVALAAVEAKVSIAAVSATYNMIHPDLTVREKGRAAFTAIASNAHRMGTNLVTLCTGSRDAADQWRHHPDNDTAESWSEMLREFHILVRIADEYDILLGVEPELANVISSAHKARSLIDTVRSDRIRIVLDAANLFETEASRPSIAIVREAIQLLDGSIVMAHAKDRKADGSFTAAGHGVIDFGQYIAALRETGFNGALVTHGLTAAEAPGVADFLRTKIAPYRGT
jgi:sugar phosphate isomerase/epimerase